MKKRRGPTHKYRYRGENHTLSEWDRKYGRPKGYVRKRMSSLMRRNPEINLDEAFFNVIDNLENYKSAESRSVSE